MLNGYIGAKGKLLPSSGSEYKVYQTTSVCQAEVSRKSEIPNWVVFNRLTF